MAITNILFTKILNKSLFAVDINRFRTRPIAVLHSRGFLEKKSSSQDFPRLDALITDEWLVRNTYRQAALHTYRTTRWALVDKIKVSV